MTRHDLIADFMEARALYARHRAPVLRDLFPDSIHRQDRKALTDRAVSVPLTPEQRQAAVKGYNAWQAMTAEEREIAVQRMRTGDRRLAVAV